MLRATDRVDLHIHTCASDGTWIPEELVAAAKNAGLGMVAVSDHDNIDNVLATEKLAKEAGLHFLRGVEICATKEGTQFHILGYGVDLLNKQLLELLHYNERIFIQKDVDGIGLLQKDGWPVDVEEFKKYTYDRRRGGFPALSYLIDLGLCKDVSDFFTRIFGDAHHWEYPTFTSVSNVVDVIHGAGGIAICAHAASGFHGPGVHNNLRILAGEKLDGFECYHSGHSAEGTEILLNHCREHNLYITAGSDCHGDFVKTRHIGVPKVTVEEIRLPQELLGMKD